MGKKGKRSIEMDMHVIQFAFRNMHIYHRPILNHTQVYVYIYIVAKAFYACKILHL